LTLTLSEVVPVHELLIGNGLGFIMRDTGNTVLLATILIRWNA